MYSKIITPLALLALSACTSIEQRKAEYVEQILKLDTNIAASKVTVSNDPYSSTILYDTKNVVVEPGNLINHTNIFLAGTKDKKTGFKTYSVIISDTYTARNWKFYDRIAYTSPDGIKNAKLEKISSDVLCSRSDCTFQEITHFFVDAGLFKYIRDESEKNPEKMKLAWKFKIYSKKGDDFEFGFMPAEIIGLLKSME